MRCCTFFFLMLLVLTDTIKLVYAGQAAAERPFWVEKSSFFEGNVFYSVGVASEAASVEIGRQMAFEHAKQEISNYLQMADLSPLEISTQMTFEEALRTGRYNIYRLLKVDYVQLMQFREEKLKQSRTHLDVLYLQQIRTIALQEQQIARRQDNLQRIKDNKQRLTQLQNDYNRIINAIVDVEKTVCQFIKVGMTREEVLMLVGDPRATDRHNRRWHYGSILVNFTDNVVNNFNGHKFLYCR